MDVCGVWCCCGGVGVRGIIGVNSKTAFFVDIAVAHGDDYGIGGDVHHYYVEDKETDTEVGDGDDVEAAGAHGEGLEEAVDGAGAG